jgi:hypothetical protein
MLTILPHDYLERHAAEVRQRAFARRRHRLDRQVIGRFTGIDATPRERLAAVPPGQLADIGAAAPVTPPAGLPIDRAVHAQQLELAAAAARQHAAADTCPIFDFRGADWD